MASFITGNRLKGKAGKTYRAAKVPNARKDEITIPAARISVVAESDVVVIGGGPGGFAAALRAARTGAKTILIEKYDMPGGVHTSGLQGAAGQSVGGIHTELMAKFASAGCIYTFTDKTLPDWAGNPLSHYEARTKPGTAFTRSTFNPEKAGCIMVKLLQEAGVRSFYGTAFVDVVVKSGSGDGTITEVIVENASGRQAIRGKVFVDGSGTAQVAAQAGAPFVRGGRRATLWGGMGRKE